MDLPKSHDSVRRHKRYARSKIVLSSGAENYRISEYGTSFDNVLSYLRLAVGKAEPSKSCNGHIRTSFFQPEISRSLAS